MNYLLLLSAVILLVPLLLQFIYGMKAIGRSIKIPLWAVFISNLFLQCLVTMLGFALALYAVRDYKCSTPATGIFGLSMILTVILIVVAVIQFVANYSYQYKRR